MIYYCENCLVLSERDDCQYCGKKNLKSPKNSDHCFLIEAESMFGAMLKGILDEENIPYSDYPSGNGIRTIFALKLENLKIFVPYEFFDRAKEILDDILINFYESQSENLKKNTDRLFVTPRSEKKISKALKLPQDISLIDYCSDKIKNADSIIDKGNISGCIKHGHYLFVYKNNELIVVNSETYEILSVKAYKN